MACRHLLSFVLLVSVAACSEKTELGKPCQLIKLAPDGGDLPVVLGDLNAGKDFTSFGVTECEDLVCVLDRQGVAFALQGYADAGTSHAGDQVGGYCSRACAQGNNSTCSPQFEDQQSTRGLEMSCRQLVLDQQTIDQICQDASKCQQYFGGNRNPFFCARGASTDGGI